MTFRWFFKKAGGHEKSRFEKEAIDTAKSIINIG